ncbi:hypothetical protein EDD29_4361 [Actinocorallia herbida]|uniref:Uncharacterized protein n=1 Tax=Actinocorallia herbida TaxID=58109 RepID=A0A3N1CZS7_9ACTN|nr:hypothetical protein [Actinocorallia herbida]ROO86781.1 hypothetical protein EDD29_4361 [Actinocorallia herbida]
MRKSSSAMLVAAAAAAGVVCVGAPAFAATWTVTPGGAVTATAGTTTLKDVTSGATLTCTSSTTDATVQSGTGLSGTAIATITNVNFTSCKGPLGIKFNVVNNGVSYQLNAVSYASGVTTGTLDNVTATMSGLLCSASVGGTTATTPGSVNGTYTNSTGVLAVSGGNLHVWNVSGCFGLLHNGDAVTYTANYTLAPTLTITSP